jgi:hypothetical protein
MLNPDRVNLPDHRPGRPGHRPHRYRLAPTWQPSWRPAYAMHDGEDRVASLEPGQHEHRNVGRVGGVDAPRAPDSPNDICHGKIGPYPVLAGHSHKRSPNYAEFAP